MNIYEIKNGRFLIYLDILGFKSLVKTRSVDEIYAVIDDVLADSELRAKMLGVFGTLYFSDTIIFYQIPRGYGSWAFSDIYFVAGVLWSGLAAKGIPARGAIAFGDFNVELDSSGKHSIFFGQGLIEAYEVESSNALRNWIGIGLCTSTIKVVNSVEPVWIQILLNEPQLPDLTEEELDPMQSAVDEMMTLAQPTLLTRTQDGLMLLNSLQRVYSTFFTCKYEEGEIDCELSRWLVPDFPNDTRALHFILNIARADPDSIGMSSRAHDKYVYTAKRLTEMLGSECTEWAMEVYKSF